MVKTKSIAIALFAWLIIAFPSPGKAQQIEKPLWELGAGMGCLSLPNYRGSDQFHTYVLPYPYIIYRGQIFRSDENAVSGRFFSSERVSLETSIYGSVPVRSDNNDDRSGMPDLDPTFEVGPALKIKLFSSQSMMFNMNLVLPVRMVFSTDFSYIRDQGLVFSPRINLDKMDVIPKTGIGLRLSTGAMFANRRYHNYFYEVEPQYETPDRIAYEPESGYSGAFVTVGMRKSFDSFIVTAFGSMDYLHGTAFEDSPLVKQKTSLVTGLSVTWIIKTSSEMVTRNN